MHHTLLGKKINKTKSCFLFFFKGNQNFQTLSWAKEREKIQINKIRNERDVTTDATEIKGS